MLGGFFFAAKRRNSTPPVRRLFKAKTKRKIVRNHLRKPLIAVIRLPIPKFTVPRKTKTSSKDTETSTSPMTDTNGVADKAPRRAPAKAKKVPAKKATKRTAKTPSSSAGAAEPTDEQIRIRAYFIAERRHRLALPGNADSDWLEAKRQLLSEAGPR